MKGTSILKTHASSKRPANIAEASAAKKRVHIVSPRRKSSMRPAKNTGIAAKSKSNPKLAAEGALGAESRKRPARLTASPMTIPTPPDRTSPGVSGCLIHARFCSTNRRWEAASERFLRMVLNVTRKVTANATIRNVTRQVSPKLSRSQPTEQLSVDQMSA